jgi:hypothetical protein
MIYVIRFNLKLYLLFTKSQSQTHHKRKKYLVQGLYFKSVFDFENKSLS